MTWLPHTTVATVVEKAGKFLIVEESDDGRIVFNQPAGHLDEGESLLTAAVRETLEETGWHITLTAYMGVHVYRAANDITYIRHNFAATADRHDPSLSLDHGIVAAHWLPAETILAQDFAVRSPMVRRAVEDYLAGIRLPLDCVHHNL